MHRDDIRNAKARAEARRRRRRRQAGMTLVEIMIVLVIIALIATAVGVAVLPQLTSGKEKAALADATAIRSAVILYIGDNAGDCPTVDDLISEKYLDKGRRTVDPWDHEFSIECTGDEVTVSSPGADGQPGSEDDVSTANAGKKKGAE